MRPIRTPGTTRVQTPPSDWDLANYGECVGLPVVDHDGVMFSYWRPSPAERLAIFRGSPVRLAVLGSRHAPVAIDVEQ